MYSHGFIKVAAASPMTKTGDAMVNIKEIIKQLALIEKQKASIVVFPELCVCGYSVGDLVFQDYLNRDNLAAIKYLLDNNPYHGVLIVGTFIYFDDRVYNCALVIQEKQILGIVPKWYLPHTNEFYESRWYVSGLGIVGQELEILGQKVPFGQMVFTNEDGQATFGLEICQDMWSPMSPHEHLYANGAVMVFNVSASPEAIGKGDFRSTIAKAISYRNNGAYIYVSNNMSESTSEVIFSNHKMIYENGEALHDVNEIAFNSDIIYGDIDLGSLHHARRSSSWIKNTRTQAQKFPKINYHLVSSDDFTFDRKLDLLPFVPKDDASLQHIIDMQAASVYKRLQYVGTNKTVLGVSGGLDSTLALLSLAYMCDKYQISKDNILAFTLPTSNNSSTTSENALALIKALGVKHQNIAIDEAIMYQLKQIGHNQTDKDVTYENAQARYRTYTLMNAANLNKAIVIGTSDMSEVALGWSTFNGDQMAMYGINAGIPKTVVKAVVKYYQKLYPHLAPLLASVLETPISPELAGNTQATEDIIGKYEINDFILYRFLECGDTEERIVYLLNNFMNLSLEEARQYVNNFNNRFYKQQFKRLTMPEGVKILKISLSPRSELKLNGDIYKPNN